MSEVNFSSAAKVILENRDRHEKQVKEFCITSEVCPFDEYLRGYERAAQSIDAQEAAAANADKTIEPLSIASFRETFQAFEKYPPNLQRPKKHVAKDINRTLIAGKSQSSSDLTIKSQSAFSTAMDKLPTLEQWEKGPKVTEIYNNYRKFMKIYKQLQEVSNHDLDQKYVDVMQKIHTLAKNMEKLQDDEQLQIAEVAFTAEDADKLGQFIENFEKALNVADNHNLFKDLRQNEQSLQIVLNINELLDYSFEKIGHSLEN